MWETRAVSPQRWLDPGGVDYIMKSIEAADTAPGECGPRHGLRRNEFYRDGKYGLRRDRSLDSSQMSDYLADLVDRYPSCRSKTAWPRTTGTAGR